MSEQAKMVYLQEKLENLRLASRLATVVGAIAGIVMVSSYAFGRIIPYSLLIFVLGAAVFVLAFIGIFWYSYEQNKVMDELRRMYAHTNDAQ